MPERFLRALQLGAGAFDVDVFGALGQVGQHPHLAGQHFQKAAGDTR